MPCCTALTTTLVNTIFPPRCLACTEPTDQPHGLCPACWRDTHFIAGTVCRSCGVPLIGEAGAEDVCESCRRHPPAWDRGAAAVIYAGAGRRVVLALKHGDRLDMVRPLAGWMASAGRDAAGRGRPDRAGAAALAAAAPAALQPVGRAGAAARAASPGGRWCPTSWSGGAPPRRRRA